MLHLQSDEQILLKSRRHWFVIFRELLTVFVVYLLPFLLIPYLDLATYLNVSLTPALFLFAVSFWTLIAWVVAFTIWTNYYLDIWIVTDQRIVNIEQLGFFRREIATQRIERVQDVMIEIHGIFETLLGFGTIRVQTAGEQTAFIARGIPDPEGAKRTILEQVDISFGGGAQSRPHE